MDRKWQAAALLVGAAMLAGCNQHKTVDVKDAKPSEVAAKVADSDMHFTPGAWETTVTVKDFAVEGMPPEMAAAMKDAMAHHAAGDSNKTRTCLTPEKAAKPEKGFFGKHNDNCVYKDFNMGGGKIGGTMTCKDRGGSQTMTMDGTYTPDTYTMNMKMSGNEGGKAMTTNLVAVAHRVGDCAPTDSKD